MSRDLPSLNAVRMFEAAARYRNFTRAAEQLFVTQGAVSRQIKHLEQDLNQALFLRDGPKLELTDAGERFYRAAEEGLATIRRGALEVRRFAAMPLLTISVCPIFAAKWLVQRTVRFQHENQDMQLRLAASYDAIDFARHPDIDAAIRFGAGRWEGLYSECLIKEQVFPVCSPEFLRRSPDLAKPVDLLRVQLIHYGAGDDQWNEWLEAENLAPPPELRGPQYSDALLMQQAAIEGQGVALVRSQLVADELRAGRLIRLFDNSIALKQSYYFVCPTGRESEERLGQFLQWLRNEASQTDAACENLVRDIRTVNSG